MFPKKTAAALTTAAALMALSACSTTAPTNTNTTGTNSDTAPTASSANGASAALHGILITEGQGESANPRTILSAYDPTDAHVTATRSFTAPEGFLSSDPEVCEGARCFSSDFERTIMAHNVSSIRTLGVASSDGSFTNLSDLLPADTQGRDVSDDAAQFGPDDSIYVMRVTHAPGGGDYPVALYRFAPGSTTPQEVQPAETLYWLDSFYVLPDSTVIRTPKERPWNQNEAGVGCYNAHVVTADGLCLKSTRLEGLASKTGADRASATPQGDLAINWTTLTVSGLEGRKTNNSLALSPDGTRIAFLAPNSAISDNHVFPLFTSPITGGDATQIGSEENVPNSSAIVLAWIN